MPITMMTLGLFGFVMNAALLLLIAWVASIAEFDVHGRRVPAEARPRRDRGRRHRRHRDQPRRLGRRHGGPGLNDADRLDDPIGRSVPALTGGGAPLRDAGLRHGPRGPRRGVRRGRRPRSPTPGSASTRSRPTTCRRSSRRSARAASARTSSRAANGRSPRRAGVPNERITLEGIGKTPADLRAAVRAAADGPPARAGSPSSRPTRPRRWPRSRARAGAPPIDVLYRLNPDVAPETLAGLAVGAGGSKFGMTETEIVAGHRGSAAGPDRTRRSGRAASTCTSGRSSAPSTRGARPSGGRWRVAALWRGSIDTFDTLDVGGGFPVRPLGEPSPAPERFARELPALLEAIPADRRPDAPGHRARTGARGPRRLADRARPPRPRPRRTGRSSSTPA